MTRAEVRSTIKSYEDTIRFLTQELMYITNERVVEKKMREIETLIAKMSELQIAEAY